MADSGSMYRAFAYKCHRLNTNDVASICALLPRTRFDFVDGKIFVDEKDVSGRIHHPNIDSIVAQISAIPAVTQAMVELQQKTSTDYENLLMEGRNIGTAVFPNAEHKFFIIASYEVRSTRRLQDYNMMGIKMELAEVAKNLLARDKADTERVYAPMKQPRDAVVIDTSNITTEEAVEMLVRIIMTKITLSGQNI